MKTRLPKIDYSDIRPNWASVPEFAHQVNASSTIPSFVEPWLIKVMQRAKALLRGRRADDRQFVDPVSPARRQRR